MPRNNTNELYLRNFIRNGYKLFDAESLERDVTGKCQVVSQSALW